MLTDSSLRVREGGEGGEGGEGEGEEREERAIPVS